MKKLLLAATAGLLSIAPAHALWMGDGTTETKTDRFTGSVTTTYNAKKGDCGLSKSSRSEIAYCTDINVNGRRSILLGTTADTWEAMHYRSLNKNKIHVILTFKDGTSENTTLPVHYAGRVSRGGTVIESLLIRSVPLNVTALEAQYGSVEYWYKPKK